MNTYLRVSILGFGAGLLALLTWVAVVYLALAIATLAFTLVEELAKARAAGMALEGQVWAMLGQSLVASGWNALRGLWDLRGAFVVFGVLGLLGAWSYQVGRLLALARAGWISFGCVAALSVIVAIVWLYVQREQIALWMAESPEVYRWRDMLLGTQFAALTVGPIFALAVAYPVWAVWRWWYTRLEGQRAATTPWPPESARAAADDHRGYTARLAALKRGDAAKAAINTPAQASPLAGVVHSNRLMGVLVLLAVVCFVGFLLTGRYHAQVALRLQHGALFVDTKTQPHAEFPLQVAADIRGLRIVNVNGLGEVSIALSPASDPTQIVGAVQHWAFEWRADEYLYQDIPVQGLPPGDYLLQFEQRDGWGYFEYVLSQGGGQASHILAIATGLLLATALILVGAVVALAIARMSSDATMGAA